MPGRNRILLITCIAVFSTQVWAQSDNEEEAILSTINALFEALENRDKPGLEATTVPGSLNISTSIGADGSTRLTTLNYEDLISALSRPGTTALERYWEPTVLVQGSIAVFWAPYDFHVDGEFTHCGIDSFQLIKRDGQWLISNLSWTRETQNCEASPLGPAY